MVDPAIDSGERPRHWWSSPWLKLALSVGLIALLVHEVNFAELRGVFSRADVKWVVVGLVTLVASHVVCVLRWQMLARPLGLNARYRDLFGAYFTGAFLNLFGPSTVAGDIARTVFLAGPDGRRSLALVSVLAERGLGMITLVWVIGIAIATQPQYRLPQMVRYGAWLIIPLTVVAWFWLPQLAAALLPGNARIQRLVNVDLVPYRKDWRLLLRANAASLLFHLLNIGSQAPLAWALGLNVPVGFVFLFVPIVNLAGMVPISFSGIGVREAGYWYFLKQIGIHKSSAVALGILSSATVLLNGLFGGIVYVLWQHRKKAAADGRASAGSI